MFRTATARGKAEQADYTAVCAREDSGEARSCAQQFDPQFLQPGNTEHHSLCLGKLFFVKLHEKKVLSFSGVDLSCFILFIIFQIV